MDSSIMVSMIPLLANLAKDYYGEDDDISKENYLKYEYYDNPYGDSIISVATDQNHSEVYGQYAVMPRQIKVGGSIFSCVMSGNTLTSKEHYGEGVFTTLAMDVYEKVEARGNLLAYGMPNQNSYPGFVNKLDFNDIGSIPLLLKPANIGNLVTEYTGFNISKQLFIPFKKYFDRQIEINDKHLNIVEVNYDNLNLMDEFWNRVKDKYPIMIPRDSTYIKHRYLDNPERNYRCYLALLFEEPVAFIVGRNMKVSGLSCGMIGDLLFVKHCDEFGSALLNRITAELTGDGANLLGCLMLPHAEEYKLLKKHRFIKCPKAAEPQPFKLIVRVFDNGDPPEGLNSNIDIKDINRWFFTMGDYDIV